MMPWWIWTLLGIVVVLGLRSALIRFADWLATHWGTG